MSYSDPDSKYQRRRQISFRIGVLGQERLEQVSALFNMRGSEYVKALLYKDLAIFNEPVDRRKKQRKKQNKDKKSEWNKD